VKLLNWLLCRLMGYWWEDCPICGEGFGGNFAKYVAVCIDYDSEDELHNEWAVAVCPKCSRDRGERFKWKGHTYQVEEQRANRCCYHWSPRSAPKYWSDSNEV
jgi:hypothetical protein